MWKVIESFLGRDVLMSFVVSVVRNCKATDHPVPDAKEGEAKEEAKGATDLGHEGGQGVDVGLLLHCNAVAGEAEHEPHAVRAVSLSVRVLV